MVPFSVLDLSPIIAGGDARQALLNTRNLAQHAERWGYRRYWLAEHHNMAGIASAATSVVIGDVANHTSTIRVGAGGVMLPNHSPLVIAEQFGTLEALFPGRIDLGLGRAPGSDMATARALRRNLATAAESFPQDVLELMAYFRGEAGAGGVRAIPGAGQPVPIWILGSSLFGAQMAAAFGLPYAFASHFAPAQMIEAIEVYRERFKPSEQLDRPYVMLGLNLFAAETDREARYHFSSLQQAFVNLRQGQPGPLPAPVEGFESCLAPFEQAMLHQALACSVVGSPETVRRGIAQFLERTGADELILTSQTYDHAARLRSFEIAAQAREQLTEAVAA